VGVARSNRASVPYLPQGDTRPTKILKVLFKDLFAYVLYFQEAGPAESEFEANVRISLRRIFYTLSGEIPRTAFLWDKNPRDPTYQGDPILG